MASLVIDHLRRTAPEETVVVYAYYDAGKREQQKVVHILASLLRQLVEASPSMPGCVQRLHLKNIGRELSSDEDVSWYLETRIAQHDVIKDELAEYAAEVKAALRETIKEKIMMVSDGMFLLARFHMDYVLEMISPNRMRESIEAA
ncbi:hypothetical protein CEP52_011617 [Fusarium oligoseptatum]|uniref:Nephrocystin 3-like N-terminal domain-containing protein n=1 Tax=Fusarium oligoseptatum TaxID=2604345 RepID=A0A428T290_9HYPO|nr:hypothetical protein CEP52_011617 [Fusarium oligoseptatum]